MIREFKLEDEALALAQALGLFITKKNGVYVVGNNESEICERYNMGFWGEDCIFYDAEIFDVQCRVIKIRDQSIIDARGVELPYGIKSCHEMFHGCPRLKYPPEIPKSVVDCKSMFADCERLEYPPEIPKTVVDCCCMFYSCKSLKYPPVIPEGVKNCCGMFTGCTSLKQKPTFPPNADTTDALGDTFWDMFFIVWCSILCPLRVIVVVGLVLSLFSLLFTEWWFITLSVLLISPPLCYLFMRLLSKQL